MIIRFCLKSLPAIGYRRLICDQFEPRNVVWNQNTFACCFRGFFGRFKSTRSNLFKSLTDTVNGKGKKTEEDIKIADAKSSKLEEDKTYKILKNNPAKLQTERLNLNKIKHVTIDPGIAAPKIKINEKVAVKKVQPEPEVLRELSDKVQKIKINEIKKSDDPFSQFQQLLTIPQLHPDQKLSMKRREAMKKKISPKSLSKGKFIPQQLAKNKTDPKLYENLTLLKDPEPQCEFLELQSGRKRIAIGGLSDVNQTNSKSNLTSSRTMTSQAENRHLQKSTVKKKSLLPQERLEKRMLLETPKIKAIKNRISKMDRYWVIAAKKETSGTKISDSLLRLRDRICQQIEASKNVKYGMEPMNLAVAGNEMGMNEGSAEKFSKSGSKEVNSSRNILEKVKIMNRKLTTEPYIPPMTKKKPLVKNSSERKLILKKINKKDRKVAKVFHDRTKTEAASPIAQEKLYSDKIRATLTKFSEKRRKNKAKEETLVGQVQEEEGPDAQYTPMENKVNENFPEIVTATPVEIPPPSPENKPEEPSKPTEEPKKPEHLKAKDEKAESPSPSLRFPKLNFPKLNYPNRSTWYVKPRPSIEPEEADKKIRKSEPKAPMTLKSAMEGFKMDSSVDRIILQAKARAMGIKSEEMLLAAKESKETQKKKKPETIRKSTFFTRKEKPSKPSKTKETILSVDKTDGVEIEETAKRSRVPIKIPENVPVSDADPKKPPPTQEEVAIKIRQWYVQERAGEDPKPSVEQEKSKLPTLEKVHPESSLRPIQQSNKKEETKAEDMKKDPPPPVPKTAEIVKTDGNSQSVSLTPDQFPNISVATIESQIEETKKEDKKAGKPQKMFESDPNPVVNAPTGLDTAPVPSTTEMASNPKSQSEEIKKNKSEENYKITASLEPILPKKQNEEFLLKRPKVKKQNVENASHPEQQIEKTGKENKKNYNVWVPSDPVFKKKVEEEFLLKRPNSKNKKQNMKKIESVSKKSTIKVATERPEMEEVRKSKSRAKKEEKKYDTRIGSTIKKEPMRLYEKPTMVIKKTERAEKFKKVKEEPKEEVILDPVVIPNAEKSPQSEQLKLEEMSKVEEPPKLEESPKLEEPSKLEKPLKLNEPVKLEEPSKLEEPLKLKEPVKLEEPPPQWEEPMKLENTPPSRINQPQASDAEFDEIGRKTNEIRNTTNRASKEEGDTPLKGAINIRLKPLSEIENLTKAVKEYEKRLDDRSRIDVFEEIISKKIETIPCAKPKLPPYYYTPYSSSTVEPEELPNKKEDKADEK